jgi:hypothetical protein
VVAVLTAHGVRTVTHHSAITRTDGVHHKSSRMRWPPPSACLPGTALLSLAVVTAAAAPHLLPSGSTSPDSDGMNPPQADGGQAEAHLKASGYASSSSARRWQQMEFMVSFWVNGGGQAIFNSSTPDSARQWSRAASLNMTATQQWFEPPSSWTKQVELAKNSGMQTMLRGCDYSNVEDTLCKKLADASFFHDDDSIIGYWLGDEPSAADYPSLANLSAEVALHAPGKLRFINLLPSYATKGGKKTQLGTETYDEYVGLFVEQVQPDVICMDYYPYFGGPGEPYDSREGYLMNVAVLRKHALNASIPWWNYFNIEGSLDADAVVMNATDDLHRRRLHYHHLGVSDAQLRWQVWTSLAHGAKGLLWYSYAFPTGIMDFSKQFTYHAVQAKWMNARLRAMGP